MSQFLDYLQKYNEDLVPVTKSVFKEGEDQAVKVSPVAAQLVKDYQDFLTGGKKLRGFQIFLAYEIFGGKNKDQALLASLVIEIIHSFLLIHDDIMDQDSIRRGAPTMHKRYEKIFGPHYGISMAIDVGDEGCFLAYRLLSSLDLPAERIVKAIEYLSKLLMEVGYGQALDITFEEEKRFKEEDVLLVHRYKTADYTVSGPLTLGAILAGASDEKIEAIKNFGIPIGIAFQIRDDELGMFSTEKELGKPVDSDLRESKVTVLIVKAFELAQGEDLKFLKYAYGNKNLSKGEVEKVREILKSCGALEYSQNLARNLVEEGKSFISQITEDKKYQQILTELADFSIQRQS